MTQASTVDVSAMSVIGRMPRCLSTRFPMGMPLIEISNNFFLQKSVVEDFEGLAYGRKTGNETRHTYICAPSTRHFFLC